MPSIFKVCYDIYMYWPFKGTSTVVGASFFCTMHAVFQTVGFVYILYFMWRNKKRAEEGDINEAALSETIIFPFHLWFVRLLAFACFQQTMLDLFIPLANSKNAPWAAFTMGYGLALSHAITESVAFLLCFHGVGRHAIRMTLYFFVSYFVFGIALLGYGWTQPFTDTIRTVIASTWYFGVSIFYGVLWLLPEHYLFRRPALRKYAMFWCIANCALGISAICRYLKFDIGYCIYELGTHGLLSVTVPYMIYKTLLADSRYWLGLSDVPESSVAEPLLGFQLDPSSARELALEADAPSFGRNRTIRAINFACLSLEENLDSTSSSKYRHIVLGAGSTSRVFRGRYKMKPVAIKMIFCFDLTPEVVSNFYREANFLVKLVHPNIVRVEGVSVNPPAICLVLELCATNVMDLLESAYHGLPLEDHSLSAGGIEVYDDHNRRVYGSIAKNDSFDTEGKPHAGLDVYNSTSPAISDIPVKPNQFPLTYSASPFPDSTKTSPITNIGRSDSNGDIYYSGEPIKYQIGKGLKWSMKLRMMMDCCRAVEYLHKQNPPVLHLDIKSANFLVGADGLLKLADLELSRHVCSAPASELTEMAQDNLLKTSESDHIDREKKPKLKLGRNKSDYAAPSRNTKKTERPFDLPNGYGALLDTAGDGSVSDPLDEEDSEEDFDEYFNDEIGKPPSIVSSDGIRSHSSHENACVNSSFCSNVSTSGSTTPRSSKGRFRSSSKSISTVSFAAAAAAAANSDYGVSQGYPSTPTSPGSSNSSKGDVVVAVDGTPTSSKDSIPSSLNVEGRDSRQSSVVDGIDSQTGSDNQDAMPAIRSSLMGIRLPERINWLAPEIILGRNYNEKADVYSLTCVLWEILTGQVPYTDLEEKVKEYLSLPTLPNTKPQSLLSQYSLDRQAAGDGTFVFSSPTGLNTYINTRMSTPVAPLNSSPFMNISPTHGVKFGLSSIEPPSLRMDSKEPEQEQEPDSATYHDKCKVHEDAVDRSMRESHLEDSASEEKCTCDDERSADNKVREGGPTSDSLETIQPPLSSPPSITGSAHGMTSFTETNSTAEAPTDVDDSYDEHSSVKDVSEKSYSGDVKITRKLSFGGPNVEKLTNSLIKSSSFDGADTSQPLDIIPEQRASAGTRVKIAEDHVSVSLSSSPNADSALLNLNRKPTQGILRNSAKFFTSVSPRRVSIGENEDYSSGSGAMTLQERAEEARKKHLKKLRASSAPPSQQQVFSAMRHMICVQHYRPTIPANTPPVLRRLIQQGWAPDPNDRPACSEMLAILTKLDLRFQMGRSSSQSQHSVSGSGEGQNVSPSLELRSYSPLPTNSSPSSSSSSSLHSTRTTF